MDRTQAGNDEQAISWNGLGGRGWVEAQDIIEDVLKPFEELLVAAVSAGGAAQVLDVGCGTGSTTHAVARLLGAKGRGVGIDISEPMLAAARDFAQREATPPEFICADAQVHALLPASFDMIVSRFGVMFFADPVAAFANLRRCTREGGSLWFVAWRSAAENPFMTTAERAAAPLLPTMPAREPDAPGQFAFAERDRVHRILHQGGWSDIDIEPVAVPCSLKETDLVRYLSGVGPVGRVLQQSEDATRARVLETILPAFRPYVRDEEIRFDAACWIVSARALRRAR